MAGYINKVILVGNVGKDPEVRLTQDNAKLANFSIATSEHWKDKESGERKTKTEWHRIVVFNENLAEVCEKYLKKGSKVYIEGQLQTRKWTDKDGQDHYKTEVVLARFKGELCLLDNKNKEESENYNESVPEIAEIVDGIPCDKYGIPIDCDPETRKRIMKEKSENEQKLRNIYLNDEVPF